MHSARLDLTAFKNLLVVYLINGTPVDLRARAKGWPLLQIGSDKPIPPKTFKIIRIKRK